MRNDTDEKAEPPELVRVEDAPHDDPHGDRLAVLTLLGLAAVVAACVALVVWLS